MKITPDVKYIGVNDHRIDLFEGQYQVPLGMAYNSYAIIDQKIAVMDTVDRGFTNEWLDNIRNATGGRTVDYLIVSHMEPDHSSNITAFAKTYPDATIVATAKAFTMMQNFFGEDFADRRLIIKEGDTLTLGSHTLSFITAPMVHWPEVVLTYDSRDKILFSADAFGKFGANDIEDEWACEARRYYFGIVGKYGAQVMAVLKKLAGIDVEVICPTHGPVLSENLSYYIDLYKIWASYESEDDGVFIAYSSIYGNTAKAAEELAEALRGAGCPKVAISDLARCDMAEAVEDAFRYSKLVLASSTYNAGVFPHMREFILNLTERGFKRKTVALIENGTWAPCAAKTMKAMLEECRDITYCENVVTIKSALNDESRESLKKLCAELAEGYTKPEAALDPTALFNIGYGLYVVTSNDGVRHNGLIVNTVTQVTNIPNRVAVTINKDNYSHHVIAKTKRMNVNCIAEGAPFSIFENFGFRSGRVADKFESVRFTESENGLAVLSEHINAYMSLDVINYVDLGTHGMFICDVAEAKNLSTTPTMTYTYYHQHVKPKPDAKAKGYVCKICGYVYEGDTLPEDFICPLCRHGVADFEPIGK